MCPEPSTATTTRSATPSNTSTTGRSASRTTHPTYAECMEIMVADVLPEYMDVIGV